MSGKRKKLQLASLYTKRRKGAPLEEINYDAEARQEFLTGFHKRKVQRQKHAQEVAAKKEREEKLRERQQLREERRANVKARVDAVNAELRKQEAAITGQRREGALQESESENESETAGLEIHSIGQEVVDHQDEYIDEDKFTTVTIEAVDVTRQGMEKPEDGDAGRAEIEEYGEKSRPNSHRGAKSNVGDTGDRAKRPKKKKKKFRYESKAERQATLAKVKMRKAKAKARRKEAE